MLARRGFVGLLVWAVMSLSWGVMLAQPEQRHFEQFDGDGVREYIGTFSEEAYVLIYAKYLKRGDTIYAYAESATADGVLVLVDVGFETYYAQDEGSAGNNNPALTYTLEADGTYVLALLSMAGAGEYRLVVGINTPNIVGVDGNLQSFYDGLSDPAPFDCADHPLAERPTLSGRVQRFERPFFVIHYTLEGEDATYLRYVHELAMALELSLTVQTGLLGWAMPPPDCGEGGDARMDIYVKDLGDYTLGYATPDRFVGNNPNTDVREIRAAYGHLVIDNDMAIGGEVPEDALDLMRVTAAHEVHHLIQFGYDSNEPFYGFYEAGAVWLETLIHPHISAAADHANTHQQTPHHCLGSMAQDVPPNRIYGEWLLLDSLARDMGMDAYQRIWQALAISDGMLAFYNGVTSLGTTPEEVMRRMAIRNLLRDYALGDALVPVRLEGEANAMGDVTPMRYGVEPLGASYVRLNLVGGVYALDVHPPALRLTLIGLRDGVGYEYDVGAFGVVDTTPYEAVYVIIHNPQRHTDFDNCSPTLWRLRLGDGRGSAQVSAQPQTWDAGRYLPPAPPR